MIKRIIPPYPISGRRAEYIFVSYYVTVDQRDISGNGEGFAIS